MNYKIREMSEEEYGLLDTFLYEAIFVPEGMSAPPKSIIYRPELQIYITDFGKENDDICLVAEVNKKVIGAVWVRIMDDYGHIDNDTPSFAISLYKDYMGSGIGTALMREMLRILKVKGYKQASLAVQKANYAVKRSDLKSLTRMRKSILCFVIWGNLSKSKYAVYSMIFYPNK